MATDYDDDLHAWALEHAAALRRGDLSGIDTEHVADEIEDIAKRCERELYDALVEMARLTLTQRTPAADGVTRRLDESPSLRARLPIMIDEAVAHAASLPVRQVADALEAAGLMRAALIGPPNHASI